MTRKHLVSTDWLAEHIESPDVVLIDGSWYLEITKRNGYEEYLEEHLPGAVYFDIDDIADTASTLPHMLPNTTVFASKMRKLGIGDGQKIVIYDGEGYISAPRVWWTFRLMGVTDVVILEGGLPKWDDEQRPLDFGLVKRQERHFTARFDHGGVRDMDDVEKALATGSAQVVDTRAHGRFIGKDPEPREGVASGHMKGAINLPGADLLTIDGQLKDNDGIRAAIAEAGIDLSKPIITSCGSGVTASLLNFALEVIGHHDHSLYDGSWTEWVVAGKPIETGE
ncbi:MAG: 3-mercaptopyruvate sulfurtransferase [Hyphomicrobiales bacterium]|nr:MAG: 3-mercaptopyruvate sulfurtransferase [Hyphomicrobiales bacterium]